MAKRERENETSDDSESAGSGSDEEEVSKKGKSSAQSKTTKKQKGEPGVFELGEKKKVTVSKFKGMTLVNIREFYVDKATGEEKPGSKGIALKPEQWRALIAQAEEISESISAAK